MNEQLEDNNMTTDGTRASTSEVGSAPFAPPQETVHSESDSDEKWRAILEQQNQNFSALIQAMKTSTENNDVTLPKFDPEKAEMDARSWINTASMCMLNTPLQGAALMIALSKAFKGSASAWLSQVSYPGMTWSHFKDIFVSRYDCPETTAACLINLQNDKPKEGESLAAYAARLMTSLMSRWKDVNIEQIAVATVLAHLSQFERRLQRLAFTSEISTRNKLQQELKAFSFVKRKSSTQNDEDRIHSKGMKSTSSAITCFYCGKLDHKSVDCRLKRRHHPQEDEKSSHESLHSKDSSSKNVTCFKCGTAGHFASRCTGVNDKGRSSSGAKPSTERRVDVCHIKPPSDILHHSGEVFPFLL